MDALLSSMTGFARTAGQQDGAAWAWELRSVNGRGLDLKLRLPPGLDAMEPALRDAAQRLRRGNVTANATLRREERPRLVADPAALAQVLALAQDLAQRLPGALPPTIDGLLALPGVLRAANATDEEGVSDATRAALTEGFVEAVALLVQNRQAEGARLGSILAAQLDEIAALRAAAMTQAAEQPAAQRAKLQEALAALLRDAGDRVPEDRLAQEVALLATRADVREELDRLGSHVDAARALLAEGVGVGRRFDFLVQEFVRETNTLCAKSASTALTTTGLRLKAAIEQLREQVQNVE